MPRGRTHRVGAPRQDELPTDDPLGSSVAAPSRAGSRNALSGPEGVRFATTYGGVVRCWGRAPPPIQSAAIADAAANSKKMRNKEKRTFTSAVI